MSYYINKTKKIIYDAMLRTVKTKKEPIGINTFYNVAIKLAENSDCKKIIKTYSFADYFEKLAKVHNIIPPDINDPNIQEALKVTVIVGLNIEKKLKNINLSEDREKLIESTYNQITEFLLKEQELINKRI